LDQTYDAGGVMKDARDVKIAMTNASLFAYVADGRNGLRVVQLTSPDETPTYLGFSPRPAPRLIATRPTRRPALAVSKGIDRERRHRAIRRRIRPGSGVAGAAGSTVGRGPTRAEVHWLGVLRRVELPRQHQGQGRLSEAQREHRVAAEGAACQGLRDADQREAE